MFRGEFSHSIDAKGRVIMPLKFREQLGEQFIITKGLDGCLFVYTMTEWEKVEQKLDSLPLADGTARQFSRFFSGSANECEPDSNGRVNLPLSLREHAGIKKDLVSIGV